MEGSAWTGGDSLCRVTPCRLSPKRQSPLWLWKSGKRCPSAGTERGCEGSWALPSSVSQSGWGLLLCSHENQSGARVTAAGLK